MSNAVMHVRARVVGRNLELLEDVSLPAGDVVNVAIELPSTSALEATLRALESSAGAWTDEEHPELYGPEDARRFVGDLRSGFERQHG